MSLWTPDGEHEVGHETAPAEPAPQPAADSVEEMPGFEELSPEQQEQARAMAAELAEARRRLAGTPAGDIIANHAMGMFELASIHLTSDPPSHDEARVAIDAMAAIVENLPGRLGSNEAVLRQALQQVRLAFVQITSDHAE